MFSYRFCNIFDEDDDDDDDDDDKFFLWHGWRRRQLTLPEIFTMANLQYAASRIFRALFLQNTSVGGIWKSADLQISGYMTSFYVDIFITALAIYAEVCEDLRGVPLWSSRSSQVEAWWGSCQLSVEVFGNLRAAASARFTFPGPYPLSVEHVDKWITNHVLNDVLR